MPLVNAKCTNCGSPLKIDNDKDAAICEYCGSPFIVERAINNYNISNQVYANTVNIYGKEDYEIVAGVLKKYNGKNLDIIIPDGVISIDAGAFKGSNIKSIQFSETVTEIRGVSCNGAFSDCNYLEEVLFPKGIKYIGEDAFAYCKNLKKITILNESIELDSGAFSYCGALSIVTIPNYKHVNFGRHPFEGTPYLNETRKKYEQEQKAKQKSVILDRKNQKLCQHCGGTFKGLFKMVCSKCGKPKDY